jgi:hypothetical protein
MVVSNTCRGIGKGYKNEKGEIIGIQGTVQDITEKTR